MSETDRRAAGSRLARGGRGGYAELLRLAAPLIVSSGSLALQEFVDRMFLSWYSPAAIAAAMPSGILFFAILSLFIGTAGYVNTFVAQYHGAGKPERIGPAVWQGVYVSLAGGVLLFPLGFLAQGIFAFVGHPAEVQALEVAYFRILSFASVLPILNSALASYFTGRGRPAPVMWINLLATAVNVVFNYLLIFGRHGFPELGIAGAALSTVLSSLVSTAVYLVLFLRKSDGALYATRRGLAPDGEMLRRLLRYGFPSGVQFFVDVAGFTVFILLVGRVGTVELAATNISFNINALVFMPMIGLGTAVSILVGQYLGEDRVELAERSVWSGAILCFGYMGLTALAYVLIPDFFIGFFSPRSDPAGFGPIRDTAVVLLRFVAVYSLFDTMNIIFASGIRGAGDTRFVMIMILVLSTAVLIVPSFLALVVFRTGVLTAWIFVTLYVALLGVGFLVRFLQGRWKQMRVI